jgi:hypothetical protein
LQAIVKKLGWYPEGHKTCNAKVERLIGSILAELLLSDADLTEKKADAVKLIQKQKQLAEREAAQQQLVEIQRVNNLNPNDGAAQRVALGQARAEAVKLAVAIPDGHSLNVWASSILHLTNPEVEKWEENPAACLHMWAIFCEFKRIWSNVGAYKHVRSLNLSHQALLEESSFEDTMRFVSGFFFVRKYIDAFAGLPSTNQWQPAQLRREQPGLMRLASVIVMVQAYRRAKYIDSLLPRAGAVSAAELKRQKEKLRCFKTLRATESALFDRTSERSRQRHQTTLHLLPIYVCGEWRILAMPTRDAKLIPRLTWWSQSSGAECKDLLQTLPETGPDGWDRSLGALPRFFTSEELSADPATNSTEEVPPDAELMAAGNVLMRESEFDDRADEMDVDLPPPEDAPVDLPPPSAFEVRHSTFL